MKLKLRGLRFQNWLSFMLFSVIILTLLWGLQTVFMKSFYQNMKTAQIVSIGRSLARSSDLTDQIQTYGTADNAIICLIDNSGVIITSNVSRSMSFGIAPMVPTHVLQSIQSLFASPSTTEKHFTDDSDGVLQIIYVARLSVQNGNPTYLYIESAAAPIDSTITILETQLIVVTIIILLLSVVIAQIMSRRLAIPIVKLTKSARRLAEGKFDTTFESGGYAEIHDLASTLTYAAEELSKMDRYKTEFIANASHDLKTPLTIIRFYGEMIKDVSGNDPEKRAKHCDMIIKETDRLTGMVNEVLELSKMQSQILEPVMEEMDLSFCVKEVLDSLYVFCEREGYHFETEIEDHLTVYANEPYIKRVIYNLIGNAVNYTGEDKKVTVRLFGAGEFVRFEVSDTGAGIPEDEISSIWDRYYKSSATHKRAVMGTGLGLSIVKNVLTMHKATYGVESRLHEGSTFWFELRRNPENGTEAAEEE